MYRSEEFIEKNKKRLVAGSSFYNPDTSLMPVEKFESSKLKFLLIFPSPMTLKTVSSTAAAINDYVIEHCPDVFIDFAYIPEGEDIKIYDDAKMPYAIGQITHLDPSHFDAIGFSISVLSEIVTAPVMMKSFERCDKSIPLFWSERKDLSIKECPIIYCGGITAACGDIMFGKVGDKESFIDFEYLGACDKSDVLFNRLIEAKTTGFVHRSQSDHDKSGYPHKDIEGLVEEVKVETVQDYIDSLFDLDFIYQPQAYEVKFNKYHRIISNKKINPKAQDFVTPYYPHVLPEDLGIGRTIINSNGENAGVSQVQVSEGCSSGGACSFAVTKGTRLWTSDGLVKIEDFDGDKMMLENGSLEYVSVQKVKSECPWLFTTKQGHELKASPYHKFFVVKDGELVQKLGTDLQVGDVVLRKLGRSVDPISFIEPDFAELLGFMHGDGCFDSKNDRWKIYMSDAELPHYEELFRKYVDTKYKTRIHYKGKTGNIWVIEGNAPHVDYDIADVKCSELYVPECIMRGSNEVIRRYLKGIFQADGWYNRVLGLTSISKKYVQDIALLLSTQGIDSTIRVNEHFSREPLDGHKVSYYLQIPKEYHYLFETVIGSVSKHIKDFSIGNRAKGWLKSDLCFRDDIKGDREYLRDNGLSDFLSKPRNYIADYKWRKLGVRPSMKEVHKLVASGQYVTDVVDSIVECDCVEEMYDVISTSNHYCVYEDWLTHNCAEGNYCGGHVEKSKEEILRESLESKKYSAAYKFKPFSFNVNYITDYKGMLYEWMQLYPKVTFINMRLEELGRDTDALKMMKLVGSNRISAPIEGISPRIQNNLLNKCLSMESLNNFMEDMVHAKMTDIKVGGIFTAYEQEEDFQWICDYVHSFKEKAKEEGGNLPWRLKVTPLVHYNLTPIEYLERKSAKKSYLGEHWLTDEWYEKFRENEVFFKVNGFRYSTFIEQSLVDMGRFLTPLIYNHFVKPTASVYSLRSVATDEFISDLKKIVNPYEGKTNLTEEQKCEEQKFIDGWFGDRHPEHYISPSHRIHIELMGSYIPRARRLVNAKLAGDIFTNEPDIRCLKTFEGAKVKCYHNCIANDPLKIYNDVELNQDNELVGDYTLLKGCERCQTVEQRKWRLTRSTPQTKNSEDIIAAPRIPKVQKIRFVLYRYSDYDVLNPNNTAHTFITKFLQKSDKLLKAYHSMDVHNMFWQAEDGMDYFCKGFQIVDTIWSSDVISEVRSLIDDVNSSLKSLKIVSAKEELMDEKLKVDDYNIWYFESSIQSAYFESALHNYDNSIRVVTGMSGETSFVKDKDLFNPAFAVKNGKVLGCFVIPCKYNPSNYLSSFISSTKKTSIHQINETTVFECLMTVRETGLVCKNCGKEKALVSISTGKHLPFGVKCISKALLSMKLK